MLTLNHLIGFGVGVGPAGGIQATGGLVQLDGLYKVHTFASSDTFSVLDLGGETTVEYLCVAGGGGGGNDYYGGGGGAGGYKTAEAFVVTDTGLAVTV